MFIKKFQAASMEAALVLVKEELGPNALILSSQNRPGKFLGRPGVEVIAAYEAEAQAPEANQVSSAELERIFPHRKKYREEKLESSAPVARNPYAQKKAALPAKEEGWERQLKGVGLSDRSYEEFSRRLPFEFDKAELEDAQGFHRAASRLSADSLKVLTFDGFQEKRHWTVMGPPGAGKTSLSVKLGIACKQKSVPCLLTSLDDRKITGKKELAGYAKLIDLPFSSVAKADWESVMIADSAFSEGAPRQVDGSVLLVLGAEMRFQEAKQWVSRAQQMGKVDAVAFARVDLATQLGLVFDVLKYSRLPCLGWTASSSFKVPFFWAEPLELSRLIFKRSGV